MAYYGAHAMTEPIPHYHAPPLPTEHTAASRLPRRAWNLAMRVLELEKATNGRGRVTLQLVFFNGEWLLAVERPGELERLGE